MTPHRLAIGPQPQTPIECSLKYRQPRVRLQSRQKQLAALLRSEAKADLLFGQPRHELAGRYKLQSRGVLTLNGG